MLSKITIPVALALVLGSVSAWAQTTQYADRMSYEAQLIRMFTDTYDGYPMFINPKPIMDGVHNETRYSSTGHNPPDHNLINGYYATGDKSYCAGCNGSFELDFTQTTYGTSQGVEGVGFEFSNNASLPYSVYITFGDMSTLDVLLPDGVGLFFGITSGLRIRTMHIGLAGAGTTMGGSFTLDDLTIGESTPPPVCSIVTPGSSTADVLFMFDVQSVAVMTLDLGFDFSIDGGVTFALCTPAVGSPIGNPASGQPLGMGSFSWDSVADGVALVAAEPDVVLRLLVDDGLTPVLQCDTMQFEVDNSFVCNSICGDCNLNTIGGEITDALTAAQIAAALIIPTLVQEGCCDIDSSLTVNVLDALGIAQDAAGLPVTLTCP